MDIESRLSLSFYKNIATISKSHNIYVVQNINTNKIYIEKKLNIYNKSIYEYLKSNPIPHTPHIYEIYEENFELIVIEEYISGETLEQILESDRKLDDNSIRDIMLQLCHIISEFHGCNPPIIHRDIKPSNVILTPSNEVFLLDFNAAKYQNNTQNEDTTLLGTKGYAAPEQYGFGSSTIQTDIYAIGMLLNTLVNGSFSQYPVLNSAFTEIIQKCVKLDAKERYHDVNSIIKVLYNKNANKSVQKSERKWQDYLPPGFRSLSPLFMIISGIGYSFIFWLCTTLEIKDSTPISLFIEKIFCLIMFLSIIFCSANYLDVQSLFPPCRTNNKVLHFLSVVLLDVLVFISTMVLMIMLVMAVT